MTALKEFRTFTYALAASGEEDIRTSGNYIVALAATGTFKIGRADGPPFDFEAGLKVKLPEGQQFDNLRIIDTSGAPNTVRLAVGFGDFDDNRLTVSGAINLSKSGNLSSTADVVCNNAAATVVKALTATRRSIEVQNLDAVASLRVGDAAVTATRGLRLGPGESVTLATTAAVSVRNDSGAPVSVAVLEVLD